MSNLLKGAIQLEAFFTKALEFFKLGTKHLITVFILTGLALFLPKEFTEWIQLTSFIEKFRAWFGGIFIVSSVLVIVNTVHVLIKKLSDARIERKIIKNQEKKLRQLTPEEKRILLFYFVNNTTSQTLAYNSGVVRELEYYDIITRTSNMSQRWHFFPYNIQPWARAYLSKHPELLNVTEDEERILKLEMENEGWNW